MKYFYTLLLARPWEKELISVEGPECLQVGLPVGCPRLHSTQKTILSRVKNGMLVQQQLYHNSYYLELVWLDATQPVSINYDIQESAVVLFYMFQGQMKIRDILSDEPEMQTKEGFHYLTQGQPGSYTAVYPKGQHLCFFIVVPDSWMTQHGEAFPLLSKLIMCLKGGQLASYEVPQIFTNRRLNRWFSKQRRVRSSNPAILEVFVLQILAHLIQVYDDALARHNALALKALECIQEQYTSQDFTHLQLTTQLFTSRKTLFQRFKAAFGCTPSEFATRLRMQHAHRLITQEKLPIREVYFTVGYSSESAFRTAYKSYLESLNK